MGHYTTYVVLPPMHRNNIGDALTERMAPYDENLPVTPYRTPEHGTPEQHWCFEELASKNAFGRALPSRQTTSSDKTPPRSGIGWGEYVEVFNTDMGHEATTTYDGTAHVNSDFLFHDPDQDTAYSMSERNPDARWDYWKLGSAANFKPFHVHRPWTLPVLPRGKEIALPGNEDSLTVDRDGRTAGARRQYIDFEAAAASIEKRATEEWHMFRSWQPADAPPPRLPESFDADLPDIPHHKKHGTVWEKTWAQPLMENMKRSASLDWRMSDPESVILANLMPLETYLVRAREHVLVPAQILTLDQKWMTYDDHGPYETGHIRYRQEAATYLRDIPAEHWLIALDTHI